MNRVSKAILVSAAAASVIAGGIGVAGASSNGSSESNDENEAPITGEALDKATAAALAETGGGEVTETEIEDEDSFYEVEVTLDDGTELDVQLDEQFNVIGVEDDTNEEPHDD